MSKLTKALQTIKDCCEENEWCDMCPLGYIDDEGAMGCRLKLWAENELEPCDWSLEEVAKYDK